MAYGKMGKMAMGKRGMSSGRGMKKGRRGSGKGRGISNQKFVDRTFAGKGR